VRFEAALLVVLAVLVGGDAAAIRPPGGKPPSAADTWLGRVRAAAALPVLVACRDEALAAVGKLEVVPKVGRPQPGTWRRAAEQARACAARAPAASVADHQARSVRLGTSIGEVLAALAVVVASAESGAERAQAALIQRAMAIRPVLKGQRLELFDAEGEPDCNGCDVGNPATYARAGKWTWVKGPSGPLSTYETLTVTWRGDRVAERRQRRSHERP
jgi:hypothetical protein